MRTLTKLTEPVVGLDGRPMLEPTVGADGSPIPGTARVVTAGLLVANAIARSPGQSDIMRKDELARRIYAAENGKFEIEDSDLAIAVEAVTNDQMLSTLAKAAALRALGES